MVPIMKMSTSLYDGASLLLRFRAQSGSTKFGLVVQAMFAHVLLRLGWEILEVNSPGHPDIRAVLGSQVDKFEVETVSNVTIPRQLDERDIATLLTGDEGERGFFCVLNCGPPLELLCVDVKELGSRVYEPLRVSLLRSYSYRVMSVQFTAEMSAFVRRNEADLDQLSYRRLRSEVLAGRPR